MTMPELLHRPLAAIGADGEALVPMRRLDPAYHAHYADGSQLLVRGDMGDLREEIRRLSGDRDAAGFDRFLDWLQALYDVEMDTFIDRNIDSPLDLVRSPLTALKLLRLGGLRALGPARRLLLRGRPAGEDLRLPGALTPGSPPPPRAPSSPSSPTWTPSAASTTPRAGCTRSRGA